MSEEHPRVTEGMPARPPLMFARNWSQDRWAVLFTVILFIVCIGIVVVIWPENSVYGKDTGLRYLQLLNLRAGSLAVQYPGRPIDPQLNFAPYDPSVIINDSIFVFVTPFLPLLTVPFYNAFGYHGVYVVPILSAVGAAFVTYKIGQEMELRAPASLILILGLATPVLFYAVSFWDHTLALFFVALGLLLLIRAIKYERHWFAAASGLAFALGAWNRYELYVFFATVLLAALVTQRKTKHLRVYAILLGSGFLIGILPLWIFNSLVYHHPLGPSIGFRLSEFVPIFSFDYQLISHDRIDTSLTLQKRILTVLNALWVGGIPTRSMGAVLGLSFGGFALMLRSHAVYTRRLVLLAGFIVFSTAYILLIVTSEFLLTGFVTSTPLLVMVFAFRGANEDFLAQFLITVFLFFVMIGTAAAFSTGGPQWGPRYLLPAYIPIALIAAYVAEKKLRTLDTSTYRLVLGGVLLISILVQIRGIAAQHDLRASRRFAHERIPQLSTDVVVSDGYQFLIEMAAYHYSGKQFFFVENQRKYDDLLEMLRANGITKFAYFPLQSSTISPLTSTESFIIVPSSSSFVYELRDK